MYDTLPRELPELTVSRFLRREMKFFDRQRVHVDQDCCLHRLERVIPAVAVVVAGLIALKATRINRGFTTPARLLRRSVEQVAEFTHPELAFLPAKRAVVCCVVEIKHGENTVHLVKIVFGLTETLFEFDMVQDQRDLYPLGVPVRAIRRGGYVRVINMLFGKISTHPSKPSERCHIGRRRPFPGYLDGILQ